MAVPGGTSANDDMQGGSGADILEGLAGDDTLDGGAGDDTLLGGDGDDSIADAQGNDSIAGGAGNDVIAITRSNANLAAPLHESLAISGGDGDDRVSIDIAWQFPFTQRTASAAVDLGAGNDSFYLDDNHASAVVTLGPGRDRIELGELYLQGFTDRGTAPVVVTDVATGDAGDVLDLGGMLLATGWDRVGNPFATGFLRVLQRGADTVVAVDLDGVGGSDTLLEVLRLDGVDASQLTAANFAGFDPGRHAVGGTTASGTAGVDLFEGSAGNDSDSAGDGDDVARGGFGQDSLDGGDGADSLEGGYGDDLLTGGIGDDAIEDLHGGNDTLLGGDGNDRITVRHRAFSAIADAVAIDAGAGDDVVWFQVGTGSLVADLGAGNDVITLLSYPNGGSTITLGAGNDVLVLDPAMASQVRGLVTVTDFTPGDGGDRLDWVDFAGFFSNLAAGTNPFAAGAAALVQVGGDTALQLKQGGLSTVVLFRNTTAASFTNFNFDVDIAARPPAPQATTTTGTPGNDNIADPHGTLALAVGDGDDRIAVFVDGTPVGSLDAGNGNDTLTITYSGNAAPYVAAMGAGDDRVVVAKMAGDIQLWLGSGTDTIELPAGFFTVNASRITVGDFAPGDAGDVVDLSGWLATGFPAWQSPGKNPFATGYLQLRQAGADVELWKSSDGGPANSIAIARFTGTTVAAFTAANFGGFDPQAAPNVATPVTASRTIAAGAVEAALDTTPVGNLRPHYLYDSQSAVFTNHGQATTTATTAGGGTLTGFMVSTSGAASSFVNAADGTFTVTNGWKDASGDLRFGTTYGFYAQGLTATFLNAGTFTVGAASGTAHGAVTGFDVYNPHAFTNTGSFTVTAPLEAAGVVLGSTGSFRNDGDFTVTGGAFAYGLYVDQYHAQSIVNTGTMTVRNDPQASPWASIAILLPEIEAPFAGAYQHWNSGVISADYAYYIYEVNASPGGFTDVLHNSGVIDGSVALGRGADVVLNTGTMSHRSFLGEGNDLYEGTQGAHLGSIEGEAGNDTLRGGAGAEKLFGDSGSDLILGGGGDDYIDGGSGSDRLDGGDGFDMLSYFDSLLPVLVDLQAGTGTTAREHDIVAGFELVAGSRGGDTLLGTSGGDALDGFVGNDSLDGRAGDDALLGGRGNDTLTGGAGSDRFLFNLGDGQDEVTDLGAGDTIEVYGYAAALSVTQVGDDVLLSLSKDDTILLRHATVAGVQAALSFAGEPLDLDVPGFDEQPLRQDGDLVVGTDIAFVLGDTHPQVFVDDILPASTALFMGNAMGLWNSGTVAIATTAAGDTTRAVALAPSAGKGTQVLVNHAGGVVSATAQASDAVAVQDVRVWNAGLIEASSVTGDATGVGGTVAQGLSFVNAGTVDVEAAGSATGVAQQSGTFPGWIAVFNSGTVTARGHTSSYGFDVRMSSSNAADRPVLVNSGTIGVEDATAALDSVGVRIALASAATLWNSGAIAADYAIRTTPAASGAIPADSPWGLTVYNSGLLQGLVSLSGWHDTVVNTGTMQGGAFLGGGDDFFDGRGGTQAGTIDGYDGNDTLLGGAGGDVLSGGFGDDVIGGGGGNDSLSGGAGADHFRFGSGDGQDAIADFDAASGDVIDVSGFTAWQALAQQGDDVLVTFSVQDTLLLRGALAASVADGIRFGAAPIAASAMAAAPAAPLEPAAPGAQPAASDSPVAITGTLLPFNKLTASLASPPGGITGAVSWQWYENLAPIAGATGSTLTLAAAQAGSVISAVATYTDTSGAVHTAASDPTGSVQVSTAGLLDGVVYHWKSHALLPGVTVQAAIADTDAASATTVQDGHFTLSGLAPADYSIVASRGTADSGSAINSADALAALRIAVGANPNTDPDGAGPLTAARLSPYQLIAADVNGDGKVNSADALAILRMAVKAPSAPAQAWLFVSETLDYWSDTSGSSTLDRSNVDWDTHAAVSVRQGTTDNFVAVLRGDVNGSWVPPADSGNLGTTDPAHLQVVGSTLGVPL